MSRIVRVAAVQAAPVVLDLQATLDRVEQWTSKAAAEGAALVAFPETWIAGYPIWLDLSPDAARWGHEGSKIVYARQHANAVEVPGPALDRLRSIARSAGVVLVAGIHERAGRSLYNAFVIIGPEGRLLNHHRKLVPTYGERLVFGYGDADGLRAVDTPIGRVGGLICWEHWLPLARHTVHSTGEDIHVALWSGVHGMHQIASRHYAFEARCYVVAVGAIQPIGDLPAELPSPGQLDGPPERLVIAGGTAIVAPNGDYVKEPVYDKEALVVADLDLEATARESLTLDVHGHFFRPDIFEVGVRRGARTGRTGCTLP